MIIQGQTSTWIPDVEWRVQRPKRCDNDRQDDTYLSNVDNVRNPSSQKYRTA